MIDQAVSGQPSVVDLDYSIETEERIFEVLANAKPMSVSMQDAGWYSSIVVLRSHEKWPEWDFGFLIIDPDGFRARMTGTFCERRLRGASMPEWMQSEMQRLRRIIIVGDASVPLSLQYPDGVPVETIGWNHDLSVSRATFDVPADLQPCSDWDSPRLGDLIHCRFATGLPLKNASFLENPVFLDPSTRPIAIGLLRRRPWLVEILDRKSLGELVATADDERTLDDPAALSQHSHLFGRDWKAPAIACADRLADVDVENRYWHLEIDTINLLQSLPRDWYPKTDEELKAMTSIAPIMLHRWATHGDDVRMLLDSLKGRWKNFQQAVVSEGGGWPVRSALHCIDAMLEHIVDHIVGPVLADGSCAVPTNAFRIARKLVTPDGGLALLAGRAHQWHQGWWNRPGLDRFESPGWPMLSEPFVRDGIELRFIDNPKDLQRMGNEMLNCAGGMSRNCHMGRSHVATITTMAGTDGTARTSMVEFEVPYMEAHVVQHFSAGNLPPAAPDEKIVEVWRDMVSIRRILLDKKALRSRGRPDFVFGLPASGSPADWKGILRRDVVKMDWQDLIAEVRRLDAATALGDS